MTKFRWRVKMQERKVNHLMMSTWRNLMTMMPKLGRSRSQMQGKCEMKCLKYIKGNSLRIRIWLA